MTDLRRLVPVAPQRTTYTCPGEDHPISRAVHLSRLAAFYPKCRDCPHRSDTGQLPQQTLERIQSTERRVERPSLFTPEGVRGVHLNELTRKTASDLTGALATLLWEESPLIGLAEPSRDAVRTTKRLGPTVVVGHDERPASPDIVTGVVASLRRTGCHVVDVGLTAKPCWAFAVHHMQASAGIYVTGAGCGPSWTGMDIVGQDARPYSHGLGLERLESRYRDGFHRPSRRGGTYRMFQPTVAYQAGLWKHFHALRPLKVCCGCASWLVQRTLSHVFQKLPCQLHPVLIPQRARNVNDPHDADVRRVGDAVRRTEAHLGIVIDDDGSRCSVLDEQGELVPSRTVTQLLADLSLAEHPGRAIVVETTAKSLQPTVEKCGGQFIETGAKAAEAWRAVQQSNAVFAGGDSGRFWFREAYPTCDAVLTLARVLQTLSRSDAPFSRLVQNVAN